MHAGQRLKPGTRVRVIRKIAGQDAEWTASVEGVVLSHGKEKTGSWFAHARGGRLWLNRLRLKKDDGEITTLNLDDEARITILETPKP